MPLDPLASSDDLAARGVGVTDVARVTAMLAAASAAIREAAGTAITRLTSTITIPAGCDEYLDLPGIVRSVAEVQINGVVIDDYVLVGNQLWRFGGWRMRLSAERSFFLPADAVQPAIVTVTLDHGIDEVPADIVDLCCDLATLALDSDGPVDRRVSSEAIDDYRVSFVNGEDTPTSVFELSESTKAMLRQRFGSETFVTGS